MHSPAARSWRRGAVEGKSAGGGVGRGRKEDASDVTRTHQLRVVGSDGVGQWELGEKSGGGGKGEGGDGGGEGEGGGSEGGVGEEAGAGGDGVGQWGLGGQSGGERRRGDTKAEEKSLVKESVQTSCAKPAARCKRERVNVQKEEEEKEEK
ncbi:Protein of unknown function, partial [Gryllus bimaculatus]